MEVKIGLRTIHVTKREIDILACLLNGRGIKKTAQLLSISPKTVDGHVRTLMLKLECNGREAIIDRLEHSNILETIKARYHQLLSLAPCKPIEIAKETSEEASTPSPSLLLEGNEINLENKPYPEDLMTQKVASKKDFSKENVLRVLHPRLSRIKEKKAVLIGSLFFLSCASSAFLLTIFSSTSPRPGVFVKSDSALPHAGVFLQRTVLLNKMKEKLKGKDDIQKLVLVGPGGSGKTTLARYYIQGKNPPLSWELNAEGPLHLALSLSQLAQALAQGQTDAQVLRDIQALKDLSQKEAKLLAYLKEKLHQRPQWILLFDNVSNFSDVKKYLPADKTLWGSGKIIITTQNATLGLHDYIRVEDILKVQELTAEEKETLFKKILHSPSNNSSFFPHQEPLKNFLEKLPPFPLDISTAAYYLKLTKISYSQYLKRMEASYEDFSKIQQSILKDVSHYTQTRYGIISLSLQSIMQLAPDFTDLLVLISLLDSYHIPQALLEVYKPALHVDKLIYHLKKYSLITHEGSSVLDSCLSLHRSTQEASLAYLTKVLGLNKNHPLLPVIATCLKTYFSKVIETEDTSQMKYLLSHGEKFLSHTLFDEHMRGMIGSKLGGLYFYLGYYPQAQRHLEKSLQALQQEEEKNYEMILWALECLSDVYNDTGAYEKAKTLLEQSLGLIQREVPSQEMRTATIFERLGNIHNGIGHYEQARQLLEEALSLYKKHFPEAHEGRARTLARLAITYRELGKFSQAKVFDLKSLSLYKKYFPHNYVRRARQLASLGYTYQCLGDYNASKQLLEESLRLYKKELPPEHIYATWAAIFLGNTYKHLGDYKKAKDLIEQGLRRCKKHYGKAHVKVAEVLRDLGALYFQEGKLEKGEDLLLKSLNLFQQHNHPNAYTSLELLAGLYEKTYEKQKNKGDTFSQEAARRALAYLEEALEILQARLPSASPHPLRIEAKIIKVKKELEEEK